MSSVVHDSILVLSSHYAKENKALKVPKCGFNTSQYGFELKYWGVNQAYSRLSTTHGHITDCNLDSVVYAGVCV